MKLKKLFTTGWQGDGIALLAGAMLTPAFAPFGWFPLAILSPMILLCTWLYVTPQKAFFRGWLYGLGLFGTGIYWIFISIHTYGETSVLLATIIAVGLINILALFPALTGYFLNRFFPQNNHYKIIYAFPAYWVFLEWCRSWICSGFPWLSIGYSQSNSFLRGYASILSVYGVSLAVLLSSGLLLTIILNRREKKPAPIFKYVLVLLLIWFGGGCLTLVTLTKPTGKPITVSLVQGNIAQQVKWSPEAVQPTLKRYVELTDKNWSSKIIVWPEGAIPISLQEAAGFINAINAKAKAHHATFITGIPVQARETDAYYNAVVAVGNGSGAYLKRRLVPFGEYTPFRRYLHKLLSSLNIPMSDFIPGPLMPKVLTADGIRISTYVCYEIAFPEQVMNRDGGIGMILTVSDDAWFGHSIAQAQHLQIAQFRAMEMGRPILFVSNNGLTAVIDAQGKIQAEAPPFVPYVLTASVQPRMGLTLWQSGGIDSILLIIIVMLVVATLRKNRDE